MPKAGRDVPELRVADEARRGGRIAPHAFGIGDRKTRADRQVAPAGGQCRQLGRSAAAVVDDHEREPRAVRRGWREQQVLALAPRHGDSAALVRGGDAAGVDLRQHAPRSYWTCRAAACKVPRVTTRHFRTRVSAMLVGVLATAIIIALYGFQFLERLEWMTYDWRCRHFSPMEEDPRILCIDIDDKAVTQLGRWPWPRDVQAALMSIPSELGARRSLVDITWSEAEFADLALPGNADIVENFQHLDQQWLDPRHFPITLPDLTLATALHGAGDIVVAFEFSPMNPDGSMDFEQAVHALARGEEQAALTIFQRREEQRVRRAHAREDPLNRDTPTANLARARLAAIVFQNPRLDEAEACARTNVSAQQGRDEFERGQLAAYRLLVREFLVTKPDTASADPSDLFAELHERLLGPYTGGDNPRALALATALRQELGLAPTLEKAEFPLRAEAVRPVPVEQITSLYFRHARAAHACGAVAFEPDEDGIVRRLPLLVDYRGHLLGHLAFRVACEELGIRRDGIHMEADQMVLPREQGDALRIQLDRDGRTFVPWLAERDSTRQFTHISARDVLVLHEHRQQRIANERHIRVLLSEALELMGAKESDDAHTLEDIRAYEAKIDILKITGQAELLADLQAITGALLESQPEIEARAWGLQRGIEDPALRRKVEASLTEIDTTRRAGPQLDETIREYETRLRSFVQDRICLFGYTATSLADLKPIPTNRSAAGVMAHANMLNGLLTGRTVRWSGPAANIACAALLGLAASALTTLLRPRSAFLSVAGLLLAFAGLAILLFRTELYWLGLTAPLLAAASSYVLISAYQFIFVDSERRNLSRALGQYTSAQMARQMSENIELCQRAEEREVTAVFTDLRGFTTISEQIGAERTQRVLNVFLGRMTEVMLAHDAMVNKFIGDGIFAFWNPVIHPQPDHALRACETALDMLAALDELRAEQRRAAGDAVFDELELRIGIATGRAIVGPCGSEQKYDYTCIGDSVNVAARLESGNKFYGTRILVSGTTREQVGDHFVFRYLGGVQAKGKKLAVPIYELLGRRGGVEAEVLIYADAFAAAVGLFQSRQWREALEAFQECATRRPEDEAARNYVEISAHYLGRPPAAEWNGAIELREK